MYYNDEDAKQFEEKYQQWIKQLDKLTPEAIEKIKSSVLAIQENLISLAGNPDKTEEEIEQVKSLAPLLKELGERMLDTQIILEERMFRNSMKYYEHVKKLAAEGNTDAKKVFEDLDKEYKKMLEDQVSKN